MTEKMGCLVIDIQGKILSAEEREMLNHPMVGGVILFATNYESREQLIQLCQQIRKARKKPVLIMVDQEGGRVQRFQNEFTRLPFMGEFGKIYDDNQALACEWAKDCGWLMAGELLSAGIDLSLAPVLDLNKGVSTVIGQRAFHQFPQTVIAIATAFMKGMNEAGMASTGKHFPGHGSVILDSHVANPVDERSLSEIEKDDMIPFVGMIQQGISAMMAAHIVFPREDSLPVSYSRYWLKTILRDRLRFKGAILSDDLDMEGANISSCYSDRVKTAMEAGCDFALVCNNRQGVIETLDKFQNHPWLIGKEKWGILQGKNLNDISLLENPRCKKTQERLKQLNAGNEYAKSR